MTEWVRAFLYATTPVWISPMGWSFHCDEPIYTCVDIVSGDLNADGILNVLDVVLMVSLTLDGGFEETADMNGDGIINILDIVILINTILSWYE